MNDIPRHADVVFVGAGHNALVAAAYLLEAGRSVVLLERMSQPGGWVRTSELGSAGHRLFPARRTYRCVSCRPAGLRGRA
jgi:phytoene dehydrogenase-like protein